LRRTPLRAEGFQHATTILSSCYYRQRICLQDVIEHLRSTAG